jgi:hypothetical protein
MVVKRQPVMLQAYSDVNGESCRGHDSVRVKLTGVVERRRTERPQSVNGVTSENPSGDVRNSRGRTIKSSRLYKANLGEALCQLQLSPCFVVRETAHDVTSTICPQRVSSRCGFR